MQYKTRKKICSLALSATLICQIGMPTVCAQENSSFEEASQEIVFSGLRQSVTTGSAITIYGTQSIIEQLRGLTVGDSFMIDGKMAVYKGDISGTGLTIEDNNCKTDGSTEVYIAGNGYAMLTWPNGSDSPCLLKLCDIEMNNSEYGIFISKDMVITLEGNNVINTINDAIRSSSQRDLVINGSGSLNIQAEQGSAITSIHDGPSEDKLTIEGDAKLTLKGNLGIRSGTVTIKDNSDIEIINGTSPTHVAIFSINLDIKGNAKIDVVSTNPMINTRENESVASTASLNAIVSKTRELGGYRGNIYGTINIPSGATLNLNDFLELIPEAGASIINNGTLMLNQRMKAENIKAFNITNNGTMTIGGMPAVLFGDELWNDGGAPTTYDLSANPDFKLPTYYKARDGYIILKPKTATEKAQVILHDVDLYAENKNLILPDTPVDIIVEEINVLNDVQISKDANIKGSGELTVGTSIKGEGEITVEEGTTFDAKYETLADVATTLTIFYGENFEDHYDGLVVRSDQKVVLKPGAVVKLRGSGFLQIDESASSSDLQIGQGAKIVNNTYVIMPMGTTIEKIKALNLTGTGTVRVVKEYDGGVPASWDTYTNEGKPIIALTEDLVLRDTEVKADANKGYTWTKSEVAGQELWTLALKNLVLTGSIDLPSKAVIIDTQTDSAINGHIFTSTNEAINVTFVGNGNLTINGAIFERQKASTVTVKDGTKLNILESIALKEHGSSVNIVGTGTTLNISKSGGDGICAGTVNIQQGAVVDIKVTKGEGDAVGISATSELNITENSKLTVDAEYGMYIEGGKLTMDETSKLITNTTVAPFFIVDTTGAKAQSEVVVLAGVPTGTKLSSITGTHDFSGVKRKYWSIISESGSLSISNEQDYMAKLTGAVTGNLSFIKSANPTNPTNPTDPTNPTNPTNPSDGGSTGGNTSGGGSSSGGSSGGGGAATPTTPAKPTTPDAKTPEVPTKVSTEVAATVTGKTANISVPKEQVSEAIKKAQEEAKKNANEKNGIVVELKADTKDAKVENISAKLAKDSVAELVKEGVKELSINTGAGKINIDLETLKTIQKQAGSDVSIEAKKVDTSTLSAEVKAIIGNRPVYDFSITGENGQKVTEFGNGNINISLPYTLGENEKAEDLTVYYIDDKGNLKEMSNIVYDEKTKTISFTTNHFSKFAVGKKRNEEATASPKTAIDSSVFTDIANHWAKDDIAFVTQRGLFGGTAKDKFSPNMPMTRGMFVTVLGRLANADVSSLDNSKFTDVKAGAYYAPYVQWANKNNIISGTAADKFSPNTPITREQMAAIIANYSKFAGVNPPKLQSDEKGVATRAQVSAVLRRYIEFLES